MSEELTVSTADVAPGIHVCTVAGSIDARTAPMVQEAALPYLQAGEGVVLDLAGVEYTSSAGLRMLLLLERHAQAGGGRIVLAGLTDDVASVMESTGFLDSFVKTPDAASGVEQLA